MLSQSMAIQMLTDGKSRDNRGIGRSAAPNDDTPIEIRIVTYGGSPESRDWISLG